MGTLAGDHSLTKFAYLSSFIGVLEGALEKIQPAILADGGLEIVYYPLICPSAGRGCWGS